MNFETEWLDDARRYYTNIVGKYGPQVQTLLEKAAGLEIEMICPLHGPVWRENIGWFIEKYQRWSTYTPEDEGVVIAYGSIYGNTENAANALAARLARRGREEHQDVRRVPDAPLGDRVRGVPLPAIWCSPRPPTMPALFCHHGDGAAATSRRTICRTAPSR